MAHTPGPWSCDYGVFSVFCDTGAEVAACVRGNHDDGSPLTCDEMECNLNLLAAAPELLAVCKALASDLSLFQFTDGEYRLGEFSAKVMLQSLRRVISLATGGERNG